MAKAAWKPASVPADVFFEGAPDAKQDGVTLTFPIPAPSDETLIQQGARGHLRTGATYDRVALPDAVFTKYADGIVQAALVAQLKRWLVALGTQLGLDPDATRPIEGYGGGAQLGDIVTVNAAHASTGYFSRGPLRIRVAQYGYSSQNSRPRHFDLTMSVQTTVDELRAGTEATLRVTANWSKIWAAIEKLATDKVTLEKTLREYRDERDTREQLRRGASKPVQDALEKVAHTPPAYAHSRPAYSYAAEYTALDVLGDKGAVIDHTFRVELAKPDSDYGVEVPVSLAQNILAILPGRAGIRLKISNLTAEQAAAVLKLLPQQEEA